MIEIQIEIGIAIEKSEWRRKRFLLNFAVGVPRLSGWVKCKIALS